MARLANPPRMLAGIETVEAAVSHLMVIEGCGAVCAEVGRYGSGSFDRGVFIIPV